MTTGKTIALTIWTFVGKVMSVLFNMLYRFVRHFFPRNKCLLIPWLQSPSTMILEPKKRKLVTTCTFFPICHKVMGPDAMILAFWMLSFKPAFSLSSFTLIKRLLSSSSLQLLSWLLFCFFSWHWNHLLLSSNWWSQRSHLYLVSLFPWNSVSRKH